PAIARQSDGGEGWVEQKDPKGFTVHHPRDWRVQTTAAKQIIVRSTDGASFALVQPFQVSQAVSATDWLHKEPTGQPALSARFPQARVVEVQPAGAEPEAAAAKVAYRVSGGKEGRASLLCALQDGNGILYGIAAPEAEFAAQRETLVQILESVNFVAP